MILPVVFAPQLAAAQSGVPAAGETGNVTGSAASDSGVDPVTVFKHLVAQIVADSEGSDPSSNALPAAVGAPTRAATGFRIPAGWGATQPGTSQDPTLPAPVKSWRLGEGTDTNTTLPRPRTGRDNSAATAASKQDDKAPLPVIAFVPALLPIQVTRNLPPPVEAPPAPAPAVSASDASAVAVQPTPLLEVRIHLNPLAQPAAPVVQGAAAIPQPAARTAASSPAVSNTATLKPPGEVAAELPAIQPAMGKQSTRDDLPGRQQNEDRGTADPRTDQPQPESQPAVETQPRVAGIAAPHPRVETSAPALSPPAHGAIVSEPAAASSPSSTPTPAPSLPAVREAKAESSPASGPLMQEPLHPEPKSQAPMRTLALEFTPDGAGDVKVRLSERAGDVHISLHGTDPVLAGRVREGVNDLVGSLSRAGYDAEAWSPNGQGGQSQRRQADDEKPLRHRSETAGAEEFSGMVHQPIEEIV